MSSSSSGQTRRALPAGGADAETGGRALSPRRLADARTREEETLEEQQQLEDGRYRYHSSDATSSSILFSMQCFNRCVPEL